MSSAERKKTLLDSLERSRNNTSIESNDGGRRRKASDSERKSSKRSPEFDLLNVQALSRRRHSSNVTSDEINSSLEYTEVNNRPDILDSLGRRRRAENAGESELQKVAATERRRRSAESGGSSESEAEAEAEEARALLRRSSAALGAAETQLARHDASPDLLRAFDYVRTFSTDYSSSYSSDDDMASCVTRRPAPACLRARLCLAVAAFSVLVIVYIHLQ